MKTITEWQHSPKVLITPGTPCLIKRLRGTYKFKYATVSDSGEISLTFVGGPPGRYQFRSFRPDQVKSVLTTTNRNGTKK